MKKKFIIHVKPDGNVQIKDILGFGSNCMQASEALEKALGSVDAKSRECTAAMHNEVEGEVKLTLNNG